MNHEGRDAGRSPGSVEGALHIIEAVAELGAGATAKSIATYLRMPQATSYRLLNTLVASEYLVRVADLRGFALGRRVDAIVDAASHPFVPRAARDVLAELRSGVRLGVHLVVYLGRSLRVAEVDPDRALAAPQILPRFLHASAAGQLMLAHVDDWQAFVPGLVRLTDHTITDPAGLEATLRRIRTDGVARQVGQLDLGVACVAVPVRSRERQLVGAVCLAGPASRAAALDEHIGQAITAALDLTDLIS